MAKNSLKLAFGTSKVKEEEGVEIFITDDLSVTIRRFKSRAAQDAAKEFQKAYRLPNGKKMTTAQVEELVTKIMAKAIIVSWKGVTDDNGNELDCTFDNKLAVLQDEEMSDFREFIANAANERDTFQAELDEDGEGN